MLAYQLIRTKLKIHYSVLLKYSQQGLKPLYLARYYRNSLPSPSSTDISVAERRFGFGMVVEFTLVGFEGERVGGAKVLTIIKIFRQNKHLHFSLLTVPCFQIPTPVYPNTYYKPTHLEYLPLIILLLQFYLHP